MFKAHHLCHLWLFLGFLLCHLSGSADVVQLRPALVEKDGLIGVEYRSGETVIGRSADGSGAGVELLVPGAAGAVPVQFQKKTERDGVIELGPAKVGGLTLRWRITQKNPSLVERTLEVTAEASQRFSVTFPLDVVVEGAFASFSGPVKEPTLFGTERSRAQKETFPIGMVRATNRVFGIIADSPGLWENRCDLLVAPSPSNRLAVLTGDGSAGHSIVIKRSKPGEPGEDAQDHYQYELDGWQTLAAGETRSYTTWLFASAARSQYDAQLAALLALANGKGWNSSGLEAILRDTSLYLLRRNLMRDEHDQPRDGKYIFISGMSYGWKQWVSTGIYSALGLDDPEKTIESYRAVFWNRMNYEDNAQYYLIWAVLVKRAGGTVNEALVRQAYDFIRKHERDGFYIPPPLPGVPKPRGWKTYMDILEYDDDDAPASNQGFHCGALMAAKELGLPVTEEEISRAMSAYQRMFNVKRGFMPTSLKQPEILGQDTLYGATLTYAVFGRKVLTDEQVLTHYRTSEKVKTPYGLRVISAADGSLLPGHDGAYCYGGSWFFCDSGNYLLAGAHGLPAAEVDARLIERIKLELATKPAFSEDLNTVSGTPHGNIPYADYSVYTWLRKEIRRRLGQTGPDPVATAIDAYLGVVRENGTLRLEPEKALRSAALGSKAGDQRNIGGVPFCWCPPGRFTMGSPRSERERRPGENQVDVTLTKGFWMGKFEVTQGQWKQVVGKLPGELTAAGGEGDDLPVYNVNYAEAEGFCRKLTEKARASGDLPGGWEVRLPTEAQWEYACRAGTTTATAFGDKISSKQANFQGKPYNGAEEGPSVNRATKVGSYPPNAWGIHDMHGNVVEWCRDWYHEKLPGGNDPDLSSVIGTRNRDGTYPRSRRGSAWTDDGWASRSAFRQRFEPERRYDHIGFRVAIVQI